MLPLLWVYLQLNLYRTLYLQTVLGTDPEPDPNLRKDLKGSRFKINPSGSRTLINYILKPSERKKNPETHTVTFK
jgi:hypothetical protein